MKNPNHSLCDGRHADEVANHPAEMRRLLAAFSYAALVVALIPGCNRGEDYPATREGVPGTGGVGGSGTTSATDTTAGQGNYGTTSSVPRRGTPPGAANPESPASTVLPGTTHPAVPGQAASR